MSAPTAAPIPVPTTPAPAKQPLPLPTAVPQIGPAVPRAPRLQIAQPTLAERVARRRPQFRNLLLRALAA